MRMDSEDITYLDGKFGSVYDKIDKVDDKLDKVKLQTAININEVEHVKTDLSCHIKKPCPKIDNAVGDHYDDEHKPRLGRILWVTAVIVGIIGSTIGAVAYFL